MATIFDFTLLQEFSNIFALILIFVVVYAILQMPGVNIFKNKGLHALIAIAITMLVASTGGSTRIIISLLPWFLVTAFFLMFLMVLLRFLGIDINNTVFGGGSGMWWILVPLIVGLVIALISSGNLSRGEAEPGEPVTPGRIIINVLTEPKVLGFILILAISSVTIALMARGN